MIQEERRSLMRLLRWPVALGVLAWLIGSNWHGVRELTAAGVAWRWVAVAAGLRLLAILLATVRWDLLLQGQGISLPFFRVFRLFATGYVCNFLLPGTVGGDVARAGMIAADSPDRRMRGAATVPVDRLLGLLAFIVVGAVVAIWQWPQIPEGILRTSVIVLVSASTVGVIGLGVLLVVPFPGGMAHIQAGEAPGKPPTEAIPPLDSGSAGASPSRESVTHQDPAVSDQQPAAERRRALGHELLYGLALLRESRRAVLAAFMIAMIGHSGLSMAFYSCLRAFPAAKIPSDAVAHLWIVPSAEVPAAVLPLPGGVGAREGALALLYGAMSTEPSVSDRYHEIGVVVAATFSTVSVGVAILLAAGLAASGGWPLGRRTDRVAPLVRVES